MNKNITRRYVLFLSLCLLIVFSVAARAEQKSAADWLKDDERFSEFCQQQVYIGSGKVFADTVIKANSIRADYCGRKIASDRELLTRIFNLFDDLDRLFDAGSHPQKLKQLQMQRLLNNLNPSKFEVFTDGHITMVLEDRLFKVQDVNKCSNRARAISSGENCKTALREFKAVYDFAEGTFSQPKALPLLDHLSSLEKEWNDFYTSSRSQTVLEMLINGARFQSDNREHQFMSPPGSQIIFLHPGIVIENVKDAIDGDQAKEAVMLEILGINFWRNSKWYKPSGISAVALYADRPDIDDLGYGVAVHFANKFTLGYSEHDDIKGYFISVDLLELLKDKKTLLNQYRGSLDF